MKSQINVKRKEKYQNILNQWVDVYQKEKTQQ